MPPDQIAKAGRITVNARLNGVPLEPRRIDRSGDAQADWELAPAPAGQVCVILEADPPYRPNPNTAALGLAVRGLGFVPR